MAIRKALGVALSSLALLGTGLAASASAAPAATASQADASRTVSVADLLSGETTASGWEVDLVGEGRDACPKYWVCIWTKEDFRGQGMGMHGTIAHGQGVNWQQTPWENHVYSAVNKTTIRVDFYNYLGGGEYDWDGWLGSGYDFRRGWHGADEADGLKYF